MVFSHENERQRNRESRLFDTEMISYISVVSTSGLHKSRGAVQTCDRFQDSVSFLGSRSRKVGFSAFVKASCHQSWFSMKNRIWQSWACCRHPRLAPWKAAPYKLWYVRLLAICYIEAETEVVAGPPRLWGGDSFSVSTKPPLVPPAATTINLVLLAKHATMSELFLIPATELSSRPLGDTPSGFVLT